MVIRPLSGLLKQRRASEAHRQMNKRRPHFAGEEARAARCWSGDSPPRTREKQSARHPNKMLSACTPPTGRSASLDGNTQSGSLLFDLGTEANQILKTYVGLWPRAV